MLDTSPVIICPGCNGRFRYRLKSRGKRVRCPYCKAVGRIPVTPEMVIQPDPHELQQECERAISVLSGLLKAAGRRVTGMALAELVRQLPRSEAEMKSASLHSYFFRCVLEADAHAEWQGSARCGAFREFVSKVIAMPPDRRALLEGAVIGSLLGLTA